MIALKDKCPNCGRIAVEEGVFGCGSTEKMVSPRCLEEQQEQDFRVDDEINNRRHARHFEPDHFGI